jgi:hypothetical protein
MTHSKAPGGMVSTAGGGIGIHSLAVRYPNVLRDSEYLRKRTPDLVPTPERRSADSFEREMTRCVLAPRRNRSRFGRVCRSRRAVFGGP